MMAQRESPTEVAAFWSNVLALVVATPISSLVAIGVITVDILEMLKPNEPFQLDPWDIAFLCFVGMSAMRLYLGGCLFDYDAGIKVRVEQQRLLFVEFVIQLGIFLSANISVVMLGSYGYFMASVALFIGSAVALCFWPYLVYLLLSTISLGQLTSGGVQTVREMALRRAAALVTDILVTFISYEVMMKLYTVGRLPEDKMTALVLGMGALISLLMLTRFHTPALYQLWHAHRSTTLAASPKMPPSSPGTT